MGAIEQHRMELEKGGLSIQEQNRDPPNQKASVQ